MPAIRRISDTPYHWDIIASPVSAVANEEKLLPSDFISADGFGITEAARQYLAPLGRRTTRDRWVPAYGRRQTARTGL